MDQVLYGSMSISPFLFIWYLYCNILDWVCFLLQRLFQSLHSSYCFPQHSVPQGFVPAISALAWYYEQFEQDYNTAVQLWEQADLLKCPEAALNLGVVHSLGLYPGKAADQVSFLLMVVDFNYALLLKYLICVFQLYGILYFCSTTFKSEILWFLHHSICLTALVSWKMLRHAAENRLFFSGIMKNTHRDHFTAALLPLML